MALPLRNDLGLDLRGQARRGAAIRRLARLGADDVDVGSCEHGVIARTAAQVGRARKTFEAHGATSVEEALDALVDAIEAERRGSRRS